MALTQVSTGGVKDDAVTVDKMASNSVGSSQIINSGVLQDDIANQAVNADKIANNTITQAKIANDAVGADQLASNAVVTASIADDAITQAKLNFPVANRNLVINGAMQVAQRGTSNTGLNGYGSVDRFFPEKHNIDNLAGTQQQVTVSDLAGFTKAFKLDLTTSESALASDEYFAIIHRIEAQNLQHLAYGTSSATQITLSFYVKSSHNTGNFAVSIFQHDNSRLVSKTYTISSTNTWERKILTFPAQTSGIINNDNGRGLDINWFLAAGSNFTSSDTTSWSAYSDAGFAFGQTANFIGQTGTFEITGVQLELGSVATDFEHRSFGEELALCQRYFQEYSHATYRGVGGFCGRKSGSSTVVGTIHGFPPMRAAATGSVDNLAGFKLFRYSDGTTTTPTAVCISHEGSVEPFTDIKFTFTVSSFASTGNMCGMFTSNTAGKLTLDAEL